MEHPAAAQMHIQEETTFYQDIWNTKESGIIYIDKGREGYIQAHYRIINAQLAVSFINPYPTLFSDRINAMFQHERPKQVSMLSIIEFIKAYKESLYVFK